MTKLQELLAPTEEERVQAWRARRFVDMGFPPKAAFALAESEADLHQAEALLAAGCDRKTALRILT